MRQATHRVPQHIRDLVVRRAQDYCELCGQPIGGAYDLHHRKQRSVGGKDQASNLMGLHRRCHNLVHEDELAEEYGWIVRSTDTPAFIKCRMFDGTYYLTNFGTREAKLP